MKVTVVYNPKAGGAFSRTSLAGSFKKYAITVTDWVGIDRVDSTSFKGIVAAVGGDGTINKVASKLAGTKAVLAPLPGGTLNHFTKDLDIPQDINEAISRLKTGKTRPIDIASVNGRYFLNNSSLGLYTSSLSAREKLEQKIGKWPAMVVASFYTLFRFRAYTFTLGKETFTSPFVFFGNNRYKLDTLGTAERKNITSGVLSVFIAKTTSRFGILKIALLTLVGRSHQLNEFTVKEAQSVTVRSKHRRLLVSCDGELRKLPTPLEYKIHPAHLHVRY